MWQMNFTCHAMKVHNHDHTTQGLMSFISISEKKTNSETVQSAERSNHLVDVFNVEGTKWMTFFVLTYKLCERANGCFLKVMSSKLTFMLYICSKSDKQKTSKTHFMKHETRISESSFRYLTFFSS